MNPNTFKAVAFLYFLKKKTATLILLLASISVFNIAETFGQTTYTWNQTGTASWATAANWTPARNSPAANDKLVFDNAAATTVTAVGTQTIGQLYVSNNTTVNLQACCSQ